MDAPDQHARPGEGPPPAAPAGDAAAFWKLAAEYRPYLKGVVRRVLGAQLRDKVDSSDVVQQSLLAAVRRFDQFRGTGAAEWQAWLVAIVRNEALDVLRYWSQEARDRHREQRLPAGSSGQVLLGGSGSGPSVEASRREQAARLMEAIERLPADYQQVLLLRNFESLSYAEVAARMGRSEQAVRQLWVRAVKQLQAELGEMP